MKCIVKALFITTLCFAAVSCNSIPEISDDATSTQLIQLGQNALETSNYKAAEHYYNTAIKRYGMDTATYIEASYEIAHMNMKRKYYEEAYAKFSEILEIYKTAEVGTLPGAYKKLAQMGIENIPSKYKNN